MCNYIARDLTYPGGQGRPPQRTFKLRLEEQVQKTCSLTIFLAITNIWGEKYFLVVM